MNIKYYFNAGDTFIDEISKDTIEVIWDDGGELSCGRCYYRCDNDDGVKKILIIVCFVIVNQTEDFIILRKFIKNKKYERFKIHTGRFDNY